MHRLFQNPRNTSQHWTDSSRYQGETLELPKRLPNNKQQVANEQQYSVGGSSYRILEDCLESLASDISGEMKKKAKQYQRKKKESNSKLVVDIGDAPEKKANNQATI